MITFFKSIKAKKNPIILFILILCLNGMVSIYVNKKEYIPLQKIHGFKLEVYYMESTPEIIENLITKRLVEILLSTNTTKNIYSKSKYGVSEITFEADKDELNSIREKLEKSWEQFPKEVSRPCINSLEYSDSSFMKIAIYTQNKQEIQTIKKEIFKIEGVKDITGGDDLLEEVIEYDENKLELIGITNKTFSSYFNNEAKKSYLGNLREKSSDKGVMSRGMFIEPLQNLNTIPFYVPLSSFSERKLEERGEKSFYNGKPTIILSISLHSEESIFPISSQILEILEGHTDLNYEVIFNKNKILIQNIQDFVYSFLVTICLSVLYNYYLYKNKKIVYILLAISSTTLLISFLVHYLLDKSINLYTFTGVSLSVGMLFDNSNTIFILLSSSKNKEKHSIFKNLDLSLRSSLFSLLTTIIVIFPIYTLKTRIAYILKDICLSFIIVLIVNYLVTYIVVPLFINETEDFKNRELKLNYNKIKKSINIKNKLSTYYNKIINLKIKNLHVKIIFITFLISILLIGFAEKSIYPKSKSRGIFLKLETSSEDSKGKRNLPMEFDVYLNKNPNFSQIIRKDSNPYSEWTLVFLEPMLESEISLLLKNFDCEVCTISYTLLDSISNETFFSEMNTEILVFGEVDEQNLENELKENKINQTITNYHILSKEKVNVFIPRLEKLSVILQKDNKYRDIFNNSQKMYLTVFDKNTNKENRYHFRRKEEPLINLENKIQDTYQMISKDGNIIHSRGGIPYIPIRFETKNEKKIINYFKEKFPFNNFELREERFTTEIILELIQSLVGSIVLLFLMIYYIYESLFICILILSSLLFVVSISLIGISLFSSTFNIISYLGIILLSGLSVDSIILFLEKLNTNDLITLKSILKIKKEIKPIVKNNIYTTIFGLMSIILVSGMSHFQSGLVVPILGGLVGLYIYFEYIFPFILLSTFLYIKKYES
jgi:multidrug efflux pump subunit AcrB